MNEELKLFLIIISGFIFVVILTFTTCNKYDQNIKTSYIYLDIPMDVLDSVRIYKSKIPNISNYRNKKRQIFWNYLRKILNHDLKPYQENGIIYSWEYIEINSNTICVASTGEQSFSNSRHTKEYTKSKIQE